MESADLRRAIGTFKIVYGHFAHFQLLTTSSKEEVEIAERIESSFYCRVITLLQSFDRREDIGEVLREEPAEEHAESFVADEIQDAHGSFF